MAQSNQSAIRRVVVTICGAVMACPVFATGLANDNPFVEPPPVNKAFLPSLGCVIRPLEQVEVASTVSGVLERLPLSLGQHVKKGSTLFALNSNLEQALVQKLQVDVEVAQERVERHHALVEQNLIPAQKQNVFEEDFRMAKSELRYAKQVLAERVIKSPLTGVVVEKFKVPGEYVNGEAVLTVARLDRLEVEMVLPFESYGSVSDKSMMTVYPVDPVGGEYSAKMTYVDPVIDEVSGTFRVLALLNNDDASLPAGIKCRAAL